MINLQAVSLILLVILVKTRLVFNKSMLIVLNPDLETLQSSLPLTGWNDKDIEQISGMLLNLADTNQINIPVRKMGRDYNSLIPKESIKYILLSIEESVHIDRVLTKVQNQHIEKFKKGNQDEEE